MVGSETLTLSRDLYVPRELVFDVWTQPEHLAQWFSPGPDFECSAEVDLRVGGAYALSWKGLDATNYALSGDYEAVEPPERLIYSARFDVGSDQRLTTRVTVQFTDLGGGTRIDLVEEGYPDPGQRDAQQRGWQLLLDQLEAYFSVI